MNHRLIGILPQITEFNYLGDRDNSLVLNEGEVYQLQGRRIGFEKLLAKSEQGRFERKLGVDGLFSEQTVFPLESEEELRQMSGKYGPSKSKRAKQSSSRSVNAKLRGQNMAVQQYRADRTLLHSPGVSL